METRRLDRPESRPQVVPVAQRRVPEPEEAQKPEGKQPQSPARPLPRQELESLSKPVEAQRADPDPMETRKINRGTMRQITRRVLQSPSPAQQEKIRKPFEPEIGDQDPMETQKIERRPFSPMEMPESPAETGSPVNDLLKMLDTHTRSQGPLETQKIDRKPAPPPEPPIMPSQTGSPVNDLLKMLDTQTRYQGPLETQKIDRKPVPQDSTPQAAPSPDDVLYTNRPRKIEPLSREPQKDDRAAQYPPGRAPLPLQSAPPAEKPPSPLKTGRIPQGPPDNAAWTPAQTYSQSIEKITIPEPGMPPGESPTVDNMLYRLLKKLKHACR